MQTRRAVPADLVVALGLLEAVGLPGAGVREAFDHFRVGEQNGRVVAVAGLEVCGRDGILRSVAVHPDHRNRDWGARLTREVIDAARHAGVRRLYLLTTTAAAWFPRFGFRTTERDAAPPEVLDSIEFREVCPDSAIAMVLDLHLAPTPDSTAPSVETHS
ncbi:MAG: GNAT family N-acetyltransferase [Gemmatimonadetes bacterium]|nr:GNAT family N-acetyltransferase [Gemmatimonadota bacterium]